MLKRLDLLGDIKVSMTRFPVVALLGPRQSGKTTLAREIAASHGIHSGQTLNYFDLESPTSLNRLNEPQLALESLRGLVIIDEIQRMPGLFPLLRVLADRPARPATFLILGSASRELVISSSESLAGRIKFIDVLPFSLAEVGLGQINHLWLRGGFPLSFTADSDLTSEDWRGQYVRSFLEHDIRMLGIEASPVLMRRLWMMLCHFHGQILNTAELARSLDISDTTAKRYVDILCSTFMVRRLSPWFENVGKRQVKSPKIYIRDSGIFHHLAGITSYAQLQVHPSLGRSWEGFILEEFIRQKKIRSEDCYFWGVHSQGELDLLIKAPGMNEAYEIKFTKTPKITPSIQLALDSLKVKKVQIIYPGNETYELSKQVVALGLKDAFAKDS